MKESPLCRARIELASSLHCCDSPLPGTLVVQAGVRDQRISDAFIQLLADPGGELPWELIQTCLRLNETLSSGAAGSFPFTLPVDRGWNDAGWSCAAWLGERTVSAFLTRVHWDPVRASATVRLLPPRPFVSLAGALLAAVGASEVRWRPLVLGDGLAAHVVLAPELRSALAGVRLGWRRISSARAMELDVSQAQRTPADVARALRGADRHRFRLHLEPGDPDAARQRFAEILAPFLPRPAEVRSLPIPGDRESPGEQLPRPAAAPSLRSHEAPIPASRAGEGGTE